MAKQLQLRRGTTAEHSSFTGAVGEITVDTTKDTVVVHNGSTAGGTPLATEAYVATKADSATTLAGYGITDAYTKTDVYTKTEVNNKPTGFKNYIINGGFDVWQRGVSQTSSGYGSADRWSFVNSGTSTRTINQTIATDTDRPYFNASKILGITLTALDEYNSGRGIRHGQSIEDVTRLAGKTVTLSFWARATTAMPIETTMQQIFGSGGSPSSAVSGIGATRHQLTTSWQKFTTTFTVPSIVGKILGTDGVHTSYTNCKFHLMADSATVVSEGLTGILQPPNGTIVFIAQVQLEEGSVATPFEQRPYGLELSLCQRYYQRYPSFVVSGFVGGNASGITHDITYPLNEVMRVSPSISVNGGWALLNAGNNGINANSSNNMVRIHTGVTTPNVGYYAVAYDVILSAEL